MIPESKLPAVTKALQAAFAVNNYDDISELTAGLSSALIFKIVVKGKPYLLRVITRTDEISNPAFYFTCMKEAAAAGLAPQIWYMSIEDRICITDFITAKPFDISHARVILPAEIKQLHSLPPFAERFNYIDRMYSFARQFREKNLLPANMTDELFHYYERIFSVYPRTPEDMVACHNDLKPENIIFDGNKAWLVDWEAAIME